ncbi:hypothetical protein [uncultured Desulfobacter sp.]|uniref:hypothetical protein n=1 Tax=uncultured Desulfobacter sp. TaxID=240139 RepID=UPI0029C94E23|nr:hypothetical protein [uncultured Desulfobacter sp.]
MLLIDKANLAKSASIRKQFHRRKDLTQKIRMQIAISAYLESPVFSSGSISSVINQWVGLM